LHAQHGLKFYGWWGILPPVFLILWVCQALTLAGINVFDAKLLAELQIERGPLKFGDTIQLLVSGALAPVGGWLADRYGVRRVLTAGLLLLAVALFGYSQVDSLGGVYAMRVLMGAALASAGLVICVTTVSRWFVQRRALAIGLVLAGTSLGNALFPQLNEWLIATRGWRETFVIIAFIPLALLPLVFYVIREWPSNLGVQPYGAEAPEAGAAKVASGYEFGAAIRTANFWLISVAAFGTFYAILGLSNNLFLHMSDLGFTPPEAAKAYFPLFIMGLVGKIGAGALADVLPRKAVFATCLALMLVGTGLLTTLDRGLVTPGLYLFGLGWGGNYTMLQGLVADVFGARSLGKILGGIAVIDATGGALGPWITGAIFDATRSYQLAFGLMTLLILLALAAAMMVRTPSRPAI
jgi:MFS family permease